MTDPSPPVNSDDPEATDPIRTATTEPEATVATRTTTHTGPYRPRPWFAFTSAVLVLLAGLSVTAGAYQSAGLPESVVRAYFAALGRGDAAGALGYGTVPDGRHALLTPAVLAAQNSLGPIQDVAVEHVVRAGDTAEVDVAYTVALRTGPVRVADEVDVVRAGHGWRLVRSAAPVSLFAGNGRALATVAGAALPTGAVVMFPGAVPVGFDTPNLVLAPGSRVLRFAGGGHLDVEAAVSGAGRRAIGPALTSALATCLANRSTAEALCPLPDTSAGVPGSLRGRVRGAPSLTLRVRSADGRIEIQADVPVTATYQRLDDDNIASGQTVDSTAVSAYCYATHPGAIGWVTP
jgi:hypothetical protein